MDHLLDSRTLLALTIALLALLNQVIALRTAAAYARQDFIETDRLVTAAGRPQSGLFELAKPLAASLVVAGLTFMVDRPTRDLRGGGWLVMHIANLGMNIADLLAVRALRRPDAATGRIRFSLAHRERVTSGRALGMATVAGLVGLLFSSWAFLMGSLLLFATAIGWYRRATQVSRG